MKKHCKVDFAHLKWAIATTFLLGMVAGAGGMLFFFMGVLA